MQTAHLTVNGAEQALLIEPRRTPLDALRDDSQLTAAEKVCAMGACGACTVLLDGRAVYSCLALAIACDGRRVADLEELGRDGALDPAPQAFIEQDAFQCGYCTPGQIMSLRALLDETPTPTDEQIMRAVTGNLCRCGPYRNILKDGRRAAALAVGRPHPRVEGAEKVTGRARYDSDVRLPGLLYARAAQPLAPRASGGSTPRGPTPRRWPTTATSYHSPALIRRALAALATAAGPAG